MVTVVVVVAAAVDLIHVIRCCLVDGNRLVALAAMVEYRGLINSNTCLHLRPESGVEGAEGSMLLRTKPRYYFGTDDSQSAAVSLDSYLIHSMFVSKISGIP